MARGRSAPEKPAPNGKARINGVNGKNGVNGAAMRTGFI
jgi:hypothetical protein